MDSTFWCIVDCGTWCSQLGNWWPEQFPKLNNLQEWGKLWCWLERVRLFAAFGLSVAICRTENIHINVSKKFATKLYIFYPFQWFASSQIEMRHQRAIFANLHFFSMLKLTQQKTRFPLIVVESNGTRHTLCKFKLSYWKLNFLSSCIYLTKTCVRKCLKENCLPLLSTIFKVLQKVFLLFRHILNGESDSPYSIVSVAMKPWIFISSPAVVLFEVLVGGLKFEFTFEYKYFLLFQ